MNLEPVVLEGERLRLEPLDICHAEGLWKASTPDVFTYMMLWWQHGGLPEFKNQIREIIARPGFVTFAMIDKETNLPIGSSAYLDIRLEHRSLEVGATWIGPEHQGTWVNPAAKLLMLGYAFEKLGCIRVQLKTDLRNVHSQRAMEKMGAKREGVLRSHIICRDGYVRDTVMYGILESEWPSVREGLLARLR